MKGKLIAIEGPDGSGKTTQIELLKEYFLKNNYEIICTREPGGTDISEKIRDIILDNNNSKMSSMCESLLYAASRAQLVNEVIKPAILEGKVVICDRFITSSIVYQGIARNLGIERIKGINECAVDGLKVDLTILISLDYEEGLKRKAKQKKLDRLESSGSEFHKKVFEGYMSAPMFCDDIKVIDGNRSISDIHNDILSEIKKILI